MSTQLVQLKQEDEQKVVQEASRLIGQVAQTDSVQLDTLMDEIGKLGIKTQEKAGQTLKLLDRPVNDLMNGGRTEVSNMILKLRSECESLQQSKNVGFLGKMLRKSPLKNYVYKYQTVKTNVDAIINGLRDGKDTLEESIVNMRQLKRSSLEEIYSLQTKITFGDKLKELFESEIANPDNAGRKAQLERGLRKVVTRIQSMTEMIMLYNQAIAATDIINDNNDKLIDSVNNAIDKTSNLITVSAMIALALNDQEKVISAVDATNKTIENQFQENARLLRQTTEKTNELLAKPSMSMEAVNRAIGDLMAAIDLSEQSNRRIIDSCNDYTNKMTSINTQLANRLGHGADASAPALKSAVPAENEISSLLS
ncbi:toxic anion resistance protein [Paenibacillus sp. MMS18-CY102]|uniref:toxic anion resistance protein n=1 Tax=Paenibacillus sp. MMS18-CY102 TaxID=2682849 RepID=UPI0013667FA0|nr:toxic anion resistance protein [Paenibacillus sp. MMS18-CY102]MWC27817.1 tellurium resistance protein [Paenibacillus sp. MMS18-CY102]